jgi:cyclopropane-fatty-acyl-phospholipid synthase
MHSRSRDRDSIAYHYDQPMEFYRPWLGSTLVYSCAYFHHDTDSLDTAQVQKLDHICRKLRLRPGQRFLDIGCGWGSLILHAAAEYGVDAQGITLSQVQKQVAGQRIAERSLHASCSARLQDYRDLDASLETWDRIASVGMSEHVGLKNLHAYFSIAYRRLRPGGVLLNHAIARSAQSAPRGNDSFIAKYVFPDGALTTLTETIQAAESAGFEVRDVENLREHYARTLRCWVRGLRASESSVRRHVPEETYRIWLLYMAGCSAAFRRGDIGVYQVLLSRPDRGHSGLPLTRADWYADTARSAWRDRAPDEEPMEEPVVTNVLN